ncbi:MAG: glycosyltransferase family 39 protein, partial [Chloroflexi bacterium]|nr:glycosyltransferase family 39 protein [Chloroflexota bacterium]
MRNRLASESARSSPRLRRPPRLAIISTALLVVTILALGLRLFRLTNSDLWGDEAYSVWLSQHDLLTIFGALSQGEPHPPFYPVLLWLWMKAAGSSEFAVRLPSAILGALMVPLAARWGTRLVGPGVGLVAALLVAFNPFLVWYSQETRMYIAAALFAAWSVLALDNAIAGRQGFRWYVLATALLIYTHYYGLFVWGAEVLVLAWLSWRGYIAGRRWLGPLALVGLLYLPWVAFSTHIFFSYYGVAPGRVDLTGILLGFWQHAPAGMTLSGRQATAIASAYTALALLGAGCLWWRARRSPHLMSSFPLVAAWLVVPLLGGMAVSLVRPMYAERYLIVSAMPLILLAAAGIGSIRWPRPGQPAFTRIVSGAAQGALTIAMLAGAVYALQPYYFDARFLKSQYSAHAHQVEALSRPGDAVLLDGHSQVFLQRYYYHGELPEYLMPVGVPIDEAATAAKLGEIAATHTGAWLYLYATSDYDPANFVERWLDEHAYRAWHTWTVNGRLLYYAFYPPEKLAASPLDVGFGPAVHLGEIASVNVGSSPLTAGQVLPLRLRWSAGEATGLKVSARLRDADGFLWGSTDQEALRGVATGRGTIEDHLGLLVQPGTPPGEYRLELRLYAAADGKALAPTLAGAASTARPTALAPHVDGDALVFSGLRVEQPSIGQGLPLPGLSRGGQRFGELTLLSYGLPSEATAGQKAYLTF